MDETAPEPDTGGTLPRKPRKRATAPKATVPLSASLDALRSSQSRAAALGTGPLPAMSYIAGSLGSLPGPTFRQVLESLGTMPTVEQALASQQRMEGLAKRFSEPIEMPALGIAVTPSAEVLAMQEIRKEIAAQARVAGESAVNMAGLRTLMETWLTAQARSEKARGRSDGILIALTVVLVILTFVSAVLLFRSLVG